MSNGDEYNGWTNRETWALVLYVNNDQGWQDTVQNLVRNGQRRDNTGIRYTPRQAGQDVQAYFDELVADCLDEPSMRSRDLLSALFDIGSLYRVDWDAVGESFLADVSETAAP